MQWSRRSSVSSFIAPGLEPQPLLPRQHAIDPAFFLRMTGIESGEGLREPPEALIAADAVFHEESLQCLAATGGEKNHALVNAVEDGFAVAFDFCFPESRLAFVRLFKHFEQI